MKKLKVGMVGIGRATSYGNVFARHTRTRVTALCDVNSQSLAKSGKEFGLKDSQLFLKYEDLVNSDVDVVVLGTPIPCHAGQVVAALAAGKHVLCEVTAADTLKGCQDIVRAAKKSRARYMLAENCNYMHFAREWKRHIDNGRLGRLHYAEADYVHEIRELVLDKWRANRAPIHYCSHSLGPILFWMDDYIVRATASGSKATIIKDVGIGAIDMQVALFETKKGATIKVLRSSVATRRPAACAYSIYGTKGFLETGRTGYDNIGLRYFEDIDNKNGRQIAVSSSDIDAPKEALLGGHGTSEFYLVQDFLDAIENDTPPPIDYVKGMDMTVPGLIAHEAAMKGGVWLDVPRLI
ncbi:MAG: Gfo/Idh/MocA family oxidoreductase [Planctomycetes bacterium]|nr:Gfo/Idh/MocA family oxidoreductase [Planctomycetota bacterium]